MPARVEIGKGNIVHFRKNRLIIRANTNRAMGIALEHIPLGRSGLSPAMVLTHQKWKQMYFLVEREGWEEDDYFDLAEERFEALGITKP